MSAVITFYYKGHEIKVASSAGTTNVLYSLSSVVSASVASPYDMAIIVNTARSYAFHNDDYVCLQVLVNVKIARAQADGFSKIVSLLEVIDGDLGSIASSLTSSNGPIAVADTTPSPSATVTPTQPSPSASTMTPTPSQPPPHKLIEPMIEGDQCVYIIHITTTNCYLFGCTDHFDQLLSQYISAYKALNSQLKVVSLVKCDTTEIKRQSREALTAMARVNGLLDTHYNDEVIRTDDIDQIVSYIERFISSRNRFC